MVNAAHHHQDTGLPDALAKHARVATDGELVVEVAAGLVAGTILALWRPMLWVPLACASVCVAAFGAWGIADRELRERVAGGESAASMLLVSVRFAAGAVGMLSAVILLFAVLSTALGTWIS
jgi:hypothetical protein